MKNDSAVWCGILIAVALGTQALGNGGKPPGKTKEQPGSVVTPKETTSAGSSKDRSKNSEGKIKEGPKSAPHGSDPKKADTKSDSQKNLERAGKHSEKMGKASTVTEALRERAKVMEALGADSQKGKKK